ncbi:hypothetical protein G6F61_011727 [Rhizopus arrhizus]|nr:hypothetical protein G6F61_011727 [Rhizopus arrhizus]
MKFQAHQTLWTKYCGIINLSQSQNMELIQQSDDQRFLLVKLTWSDESIQPNFILNLYAPASNAADRNVFFSSVIHQLNSLDSSNTIIQNFFIAGDFNFSFDNKSYHNTRRSNVPQHFLRFMLSQFEDCINHVEDGISYRLTFRRADLSTCIDYIFANKSIYNNCNNGNVEYMNKEWTDHALLSINFTVGTSSTGKGLWRANPNLAKNPAYIRKLNEQIEQYITHKLAKYNNSPQEKWDLLKKMVKKVTQNFCRNRCQWRNDQIMQLQSHRNDIFRRYSNNPTCLNILLPEVENNLANLQTEIAEIDILRAGKRWIENNQKLAGYLKRTAESRNIKRNLTMIVHPETGLECLDTKAKLDAAFNFYSTLYTAEPIDHQDLESMLNTIDKQVSPNDAKHIISSISFDDILDGSRRTPHKSSPGMDGLPYEILNLIIGHPSCKSLVLEVYNDAINKALFPKSWQQTCLVLLPKTGDLTSLSNWRLISLINTDCKVFIRIMNSGIMNISSKLITRFQSGFMHNRFIGDHGFACRLIMEDTSKSTSISESLGVMLDQTKAYDRIHPEYL